VLVGSVSIRPHDPVCRSASWPPRQSFSISGLIGDQTLGRRAVNLACPQARDRLNGLYTGLFFVGGAIGSALAGIARSRRAGRSSAWLASCSASSC
jgi:predicted MFS family arabinose efflux permease